MRTSMEGPWSCFLTVALILGCGRCCEAGQVAGLPAARGLAGSSGFILFISQEYFRPVLLSDFLEGGGPSS
jgi:hypothetical protein